jgi:hypothetical protein
MPLKMAMMMAAPALGQKPTVRTPGVSAAAR